MVLSLVFGRAQMGTAFLSVYGLGWLIQRSAYEAGMSKISPEPKYKLILRGALKRGP